AMVRTWLSWRGFFLCALWFHHCVCLASARASRWGIARIRVGAPDPDLCALPAGRHRDVRALSAPSRNQRRQSYSEFADQPYLTAGQPPACIVGGMDVGARDDFLLSVCSLLPAQEIVPCGVRYLGARDSPGCGKWCRVATSGALSALAVELV